MRKETPGQYQKRIRIRLSIMAHSYEYYQESLITDAEYDALALEVDTSVTTDRKDLDLWFKKNYADYTGSWVHSHPELKRIDEITRGIILHRYEKSLPQPVKG